MPAVTPSPVRTSGCRTTISAFGCTVLSEAIATSHFQQYRGPVSKSTRPGPSQNMPQLRGLSFMIIAFPYAARDWPRATSDTAFGS